MIVIRRLAREYQEINEPCRFSFKQQKNSGKQIDPWIGPFKPQSQQVKIEPQ
jgi:hypothetical protein